MNAPTRTRHCKVCGDEMLWLPIMNIWGVVYRWRAWCREHGYAVKPKPKVEPT